MFAKGVSEDVSPKIGTLSLSRGKVFSRTYRVPYLLPAGTEAEILVTDATGLTLATFGGVADGNTIKFLEYPEDVDSIPHGANFEFSITYPDVGEPEGVGFGKVVRKEPRFTLLPPNDVSQTALQYSDSFSAVVNKRWIKMGGASQLVIHNNAGASKPNSMGPNYGIYSTSAAKWAPPMNMDSVTVVVSIVNLGILSVGHGRFNVIVCADYGLTKYMGIQFEIGNTGSLIRAITGTGPLAWNDQGTPVSNTVGTEAYTIKYSHLANKLSCYKGSSLTPIFEWVDTAHLIPHGSAAYRYTGLSFATDWTAPSVEPTAWEARDGV